MVTRWSGCTYTSKTLKASSNWHKIITLTGKFWTKVLANSAPVRALFLACRLLSLHSFSSVIVWRENWLSHISSYKDTNPTGWYCIFVNYFFRGPIAKYRHIEGSRFNTWIWGVLNHQSITYGLHLIFIWQYCYTAGIIYCPFRIAHKLNMVLSF